MGNNYPNGHQLPKRTPKSPNGPKRPKWDFITPMGNNYQKGQKKTQMEFYYPNGK